jgi:hypothetical protein
VIAHRTSSKDELKAGAESSLSHRCDPHNQAPQSPAPTRTQHQTDGSEPASSSRTLRRTRTAGDGTQNSADISRFNSIRQRTRGLRPKSWLPFTRSNRNNYPRSFSTQLPKTASTSTVARNVISAPILTSTTNVAVAHTEGVRCGELSDLATGESSWNPLRGRIENDQTDPGPLESNTNTNFGQGVDRLYTQPGPAKGRIGRLREVFGNRIRNGSSLRHLRDHSSAARVSGDDQLTQEETPLRCDLSRRRAETFNLYKNKVRGLTGSGHVRRRSLHPNKASADDGSMTNPPLLDGGVDAAVPSLTVDSDGESPFGSLTKSFTSAVDKLDFYANSPRNAPFIRSRSSFFNLKKGNKGQRDQETPTKQLSPISPTFPAPPVAVSFTSNEPVGLHLTTSQDSDTMAEPNSGQGPSNQRTHPAPRPVNGIRQSPPTPVVFSNEKNGYVVSQPVAGYPRGVNPLRMHPPDTMAVPSPHVDRSTLPSPPVRSESPAFAPRQTTTPTAELDEDLDTGSLEDAPIYSPSLGDLSQASLILARSENDRKIIPLSSTSTLRDLAHSIHCLTWIADLLPTM